MLGNCGASGRHGFFIVVAPGRVRDLARLCTADATVTPYLSSGGHGKVLEGGRNLETDWYDCEHFALLVRRQKAFEKAARRGRRRSLSQTMLALGTNEGRVLLSWIHIDVVGSDRGGERNSARR